MKVIKSIIWAVSLSVVAGGLMATSAQAKPASANGSFSDITGTNIWNNTAPIFEGGGKLDPKLVDDAARINRDAETAFNACNAALAQLDQAVPTTRRFARQPSTQTAEVPVACRQLEQLRAEAETVRTNLEQAKNNLSRAEFGTW